MPTEGSRRVILLGPMRGLLVAVAPEGHVMHVLIMWPAAAVCRHTVLVDGEGWTINPNPNYITLP